MPENIDHTALSEALRAFSRVEHTQKTNTSLEDWYVRIQESDSDRVTTALTQLNIAFDEINVVNPSGYLDITLDFENYQKLFLIGLIQSCDNINITSSKIDATGKVTLYFSSLSDEFKNFLNRYQLWAVIRFTNKTITIDKDFFPVFNKIMQTVSNTEVKDYLSAISSRLSAAQHDAPIENNYNDDFDYNDDDDTYLTHLKNPSSSSSKQSSPNPIAQATGSIRTSSSFLTNPTVTHSLKTFLTGQKNWNVQITDNTGKNITGAVNLSIDAGGKLNADQINVTLKNDGTTGSPTAGFLIFDDHIKFPPTLCNKESYKGAYDMLKGLNTQWVDIEADNDNPKILKDLFLQAVNSGLIPIIQSNTGNANIQQEIIERLKADYPHFIPRFQALLKKNPDIESAYEDATNPGRPGFTF